MTERKQAIDACLTFPNVYEDYPFDDFNWTVMRHKGNKKAFAFIYRHNGQMKINVKAQPFLVEVWQRQYSAVTSGYHMNKRHWVTIVLDDTLPDDVILQLLSDSFELTKPTIRLPR